MTTRPTQLAIVEGMDHPVGRIPQSVMGGGNADLIAAIAPLYLAGSVLDVTYGRGMWWRRFSPSPFAAHDISVDGVDFRSLPEDDATWDAVCFDPPYTPRQGPAEATRLKDRDFRAKYGLDVSRSRAETNDLILAGLVECARVARRWVLVKCNDYVNGRQFHLGHAAVLQEGERLGLRIHDLIVHASGPGPGGREIKTVLRARRAHSYLLVFRKTGRR